jgi:adenosylhomocysteine nucleosidase
MKILTIIPMQRELDSFVQACCEAGYDTEAVATGRLSLTYFPALAIAVAPGGLGKTQFAVHTQHLLEQGQWELVICAGAAGALVDSIAVGDVVIATETVEHDIRNRFGPPRLPRFRSAEHVLELCRHALQTEQAFRVHYGPIASGDEDVVEGERRAAIHAHTGAVVVAWEGAGGARASQFSDVPFIEIRGVTDSANSAAAVDFKLNVKWAMHNVARVVASLARARRGKDGCWAG